MRIGIDISQTVFQGTGVAKYSQKLVEQLLSIDKENKYVLFFSSLRREVPDFVKKLPQKKFTLKSFCFPLTFLDFLWNRLHFAPIEWFVGPVDIFLSSDWLQPPSKKAQLVTVVHDLSIFTHPQFTDKKIINVHKHRLKQVKKQCSQIIADSQNTKNDLIKILGIDKEKITLIYPGV